MPLLSIYSLALEQDLEFGYGMVQAVGTLQTQTFMQVGCTWQGGPGRGCRGPPLMARLALAPELAAAGAREAQEGDQGAVAPRAAEAGTGAGGAGAAQARGGGGLAQAQSQPWFPRFADAWRCGLCGWWGRSCCHRLEPVPPQKMPQPRQPQLRGGGPGPPEATVVASDVVRRGVSVAGTSTSGLEGG